MKRNCHAYDTKKSIYSFTGASCSTARISWRFSCRRAARRSRIALIEFSRADGTLRVTYLVLDTTGLHLVSQDLCAGLLGLGLVDVLHNHTLILEDVTL